MLVHTISAKRLKRGKLHLKCIKCSSLDIDLKQEFAENQFIQLVWYLMENKDHKH